MLAPLIVVSLLIPLISPIGGEEAAVQGGGSMMPDFSQCAYAPYICPNENITFWLYTRFNTDNPFELTLDNIRNAPYDYGAPFVVLMHGYTGYRDYSPNMELRPAFLAQGQYNIISLDWGPLCREPCYVQAAYNVKTVANCTARMLLQMMDELPRTINMDNLHIIGFSLGAQVAGNTGWYFKQLANKSVKWMTGMDPALPLFDSVLVSADSRISIEDADFLDIYHTDAGNKGIIRPVGDVDFYLNSGYSQPGCGTNNSCDHVRSVMYYAESLDKSSKGFWGAPCTLVNAVNYFTSTAICKSSEGAKTTTPMGYYTPHTTRGTYQVLTNSAPPFALGMNPQVDRKRRSSLLGWLFGK